MKKHLNNPELFFDSGCLSRKAVFAYRAGTLTSREQHVIEKHAAGCALCNAALSGILRASDPAAADNILRKKIQQQFVPGKTNSLKYIVLIFSIVLTGTALYLFQSKNELEHLTADMPVARDGIAPAAEPTPDPANSILSNQETNRENNRGQSVSEKKQEENFIQPFAEISPPLPENPQPVNSTLHQAPVATLVEAEKPSDENTEPVSKTKKAGGVRIKYLEGYKTVGFEVLHPQKRTFDLPAGYVPPQYENRDHQSFKDKKYESPVKTLSYVSVMESGLGKFKSGEYVAALEEFSLVLSNYPDDLNAYFYSGLCYYHMGKHEKSILEFNKTLKHKITSFYEEAKWYKALSLFASDKPDEATIILREIVTENGFYKKEALKKLNEIK